MAVVVLGALPFASERADAQTTPPPAVTATGTKIPDRVVGGATVSSRPQNLNPTGVNYTDCTSDMTLQFPVFLANFDGTMQLAVWAGTSDCTSDTARGNASLPACWLVGQPLVPDMVGSGGRSLNIPVRVQDIVGHQNNKPSTPVYSRVGPEACTAQTVDTAQTINVLFIPLTATGLAISNATSWNYALKTDLVGPAAPANLSVDVGDTLFVVHWTPNTDADTASYNVYMDPFPGQEAAGTVGAEAVLVCPDSSARQTSNNDAEAGTDGSAEGDGSTEAGGISDAAPVCQYVVNGGGSASSSCGSAALGAAPIVDLGGATSTTTDDSGTTTTTGGGGISNLPSGLLLGPGGTIPTVSDKNTGSYTVTGLKNGDPVNGPYYNVVVAAVDGSGNVGPQTTQRCDYPAPVDDFWTVYRQNGGLAGGGFCALGAAGKPVPAVAGASLLLATGVGLLRRFRRRRQAR